MSYGTKFTIDFKNIDDCMINVSIQERDYSGLQTQLKASGQSPVVIDYKSGDFYANDPIRGSSCTVKYFNTGDLPVTEFVSDDDSKYKTEIWMTKPGGSPVLVWSGLLSQDNCIEDMTPAPNEVSLMFTDGLGSLREAYFTDLSGELVYGQLSLATVFNYILEGKIGLNLPVRVFCNLFEIGMNNRTADLRNEPFSQCIVDAQSFIHNQQTVQDFASSPNAQIVKLKDKVQDCYTIMQNILDAWGCTIIQADGFWNIIRWHELKQFSNAVPGTRYDPDFTNPTAVTFDNIKTIQNSTPTADFQAINLTQWRQLFRGNEYVRLTFNYVQPYSLLKNSDLTILGDFIPPATTEGSGSDLVTKKDFVFTDWQVSPENSVVPYPLQTYIRVEYNWLNVERKRYAVVARGVIGQSIWSTPFKVNVNDRANLSFSMFTNNNTDPGTTVFNIKIFPPGTTNFTIAGGVPYYGLKVDSKGFAYWAYNSSGWAFYHDDLFTETQASIDMPGFPIDGIMLVQLPTATTDGSGTSFTAYSSINFTLYYYIEGSLQVNGQYNESLQSNITKKNIDKLVYFDDSPKDDIQGVMFLANGATKTYQWRRWPIDENRRFGFIQSVDWMYLTKVMRSKIDGMYRGLTDSAALPISALSVIQFEAVENANFIFGQVSFDLKNAEFSGTVQELYKSGEYAPGFAFSGSEFTNTFSYLFISK